MKRLTNFVLFGPLLIWVTFVAMLLPLIIGPQGFAGLGEFLFIALLICYAPGIIPLLALAGLDEVMSRHRVNVWLRVLICGAIGFAAAFALFYYLLKAAGARQEIELYGLWLGLMGGVPAVVCTWLSGRNKMKALKA